MKVYFIGVGEAFDPEYSNSCFVCESIMGERLLLDCGYSTPQSIWKTFPEPNSIDFIYITHWHADHCYGLPALITQFWQAGRRKPLFICGQKGTEEFIRFVCDKAYPGILDLLDGNTPNSYQLTFMESDHEFHLNDFELRLAPTSHIRKNLAVRVTVKENSQKKSIAYSGDGGFTPKTRELYKGVDLLIHESYSLQEIIQGHCSVEESIEESEKLEISQLALVHIERVSRLLHKNSIMDRIAGANLPVIVPEPGEVMDI